MKLDPERAMNVDYRYISPGFYDNNPGNTYQDYANGDHIHYAPIFMQDKYELIKKQIIQVEV
jgi:hypothetical protein